MILISYNRDTRTIHMTSFLRDTLVPINPRGTLWNRINSLYYTGGPGRIINTFNNLFSLDIQRYAAVRFSGVFELVDAFGGLELHLSAEEAAVINRIFPDFDSVSEGSNILNGRQVLAYSRIRIIDNDIERSQRQRNVLRNALDKVLDTSSIFDVFAMGNFILDNVQTNVPLHEMITIGLELFIGSRPTVQELRIPVDESFNHGRFFDAYILTIDFEENITALHEFIYSCAFGVNFPNFTLPDAVQPLTEPAEEDGDGEDLNSPDEHLPDFP
jgi:LCP family protein required for cell wall assembly